jgi:ribulose 1,5-bisphosphate synthetase/thiazole synthase
LPRLLPVTAAIQPWSRREPMRLDDLVDADVIVVGAGLAGLAATAELASAGRRVLLLDQEP